MDYRWDITRLCLYTRLFFNLILVSCYRAASVSANSVYVHGFAVTARPPVNRASISFDLIFVLLRNSFMINKYVDVSQQERRYRVICANGCPK
jgi:hypothetical protein